MKLRDLMAELAKVGEHAAQGARTAYIEHIEQFASETAKLPGDPAKMTVTPLSALFTAKTRLRFNLSLSEGENGEIEADLDSEAKGKSVFPWKRRPPALAQVEMEWGGQDAPEAVCRIRDAQDDVLDHKMRHEKWVRIASLARQATEGETDG